MIDRDPNQLFKVRLGIELCRSGMWQEGLTHLGEVEATERNGSELPGLFFSYLGYGLVRSSQRVREGVRLCEHAVRVDVAEPENYLNLARAQLLGGDQAAAVDTLRRGLRVDGEHPGLLELERELGRRTGRVLACLPRGHCLNRWLGRLRHRLRGVRL